MQRREIAHRVVEQLHVELRLGDNAAGAAAPEALVPLRFESVALLLADHLVGDRVVGEPGGSHCY